MTSAAFQEFAKQLEKRGEHHVRAHLAAGTFNPHDQRGWAAEWLGMKDAARDAARAVETGRQASVARKANTRDNVAAAAAIIAAVAAIVGAVISYVSWLHPVPDPPAQRAPSNSPSLR